MMHFRVFVSFRDEADLAQFSAAIYKKISMDAKKQRFQGFRPGTLPPHLLPTYRAFAMDECAREAVMEAMEQNQIRPFETCRQDILIQNVSIPPPKPANKKKKKKKKKEKGGKKNKKGKNGEGDPAAVDATAVDTDGVEPEVEEEEEEKEKEPPQWRTFETMKEAIDAGWQPGQSFSFMATKVSGQKQRDSEMVRPDNLPF